MESVDADKANEQKKEGEEDDDDDGKINIEQQSTFNRHAKHNNQYGVCVSPVGWFVCLMCSDMILSLCNRSLLAIFDFCISHTVSQQE